MIAADRLTAVPPDWPRFLHFPEFRPAYSPEPMMALGIFGGTYFSTRPEDWFALPAFWRAGIPEPINRLAAQDVYMAEHNLFGVRCGQTLRQWQDQGWIDPQDPLGWFQWYTRFYSGRRSDDDARQIGRWRAFIARHSAQLAAACHRKGTSLEDLEVSPVRRQALLHWAWDSREPAP